MNSKKVTLRIVRKEEPKKLVDWIGIWSFVAIAGFLIFVLTPIISSDFYSPISTSLYFLGLLMIISPVFCFQFNLYAGTSDLKMEWRDLLSVWFYAFNVIFIAANGVLFAFLNIFLRVVPVNESQSIASGEYWGKSIYFILGLYVLINLSAFAYRWLKK
jgi:hypothetical protein